MQNTCRLCLSQSVKAVAQSPSCDHIFCTSCLIDFVVKHSSTKCPICAESLVVSTSKDHGKILNKAESKLSPAVGGTNFQSHEECLSERRRIMKEFNDNKVKFIKSDGSGSDFLLQDYHRMSKIQREHLFDYIIHSTKSFSGDGKIDLVHTPIYTSLSESSEKKVSSKKTDSEEKKKPILPRDPGVDASPYERCVYDRKVIMKDFNDGRVKFLRHDGSDFLVVDYRSLSKEEREDLSKFVSGSTGDFADDGCVFIPDFEKLAVRSEHDSNAKTSEKKLPLLKEPGSDATPYEFEVYKQKVTRKRFNDNKIKFIRNDGSDFKLQDYHRLSVEERSDLSKILRGIVKSFGDNESVFVPNYVEYKYDSVPIKLPTEKRPKQLHFLVQQQNETEVSKEPKVTEEQWVDEETVNETSWVETSVGGEI